MSNVVPFNFENNSVRVIDINNEPWFVARDVAIILGYSNISDAIIRHCKGVAKHDTPTTSGIQSLSVIPVRKTGAYSIQGRSIPDFNLGWKENPLFI